MDVKAGERTKVMKRQQMSSFTYCTTCNFFYLCLLCFVLYSCAVLFSPTLKSFLFFLSSCRSVPPALLASSVFSFCFLFAAQSLNLSLNNSVHCWTQEEVCKILNPNESNETCRIVTSGHSDNQIFTRARTCCLISIISHLLPSGVGFKHLQLNKLIKSETENHYFLFYWTTKPGIFKKQRPYLVLSLRADTHSTATDYVALLFRLCVIAVTLESVSTRTDNIGHLDLCMWLIALHQSLFIGDQLNPY